jgi:hypothetical protein
VPTAPTPPEEPRRLPLPIGELGSQFKALTAQETAEQLEAVDVQLRAIERRVAAAERKLWRWG